MAFKWWCFKQKRKKRKFLPLVKCFGPNLNGNEIRNYYLKLQIEKMLVDKYGDFGYECFNYFVRNVDLDLTYRVLKKNQ